MLVQPRILSLILLKCLLFSRIDNFFLGMHTDKHFVALVYGWSAQINPADIGPYPVKGTQDAPPAGETTAITFHTPGLYYYYCSAHADVNLTWHRAQAHKDASEFPIPMEGFVLVVGR